MPTYAFTGHRPKDIPNLSYGRFAALLDRYLLVHEPGPIQFITGGALGIDTMAAEYAISHHITLHLVLPFRPEVMGRFWNDHDRSTLAMHIYKAKSLTIINEGRYDVRDYQRRNERMVDAADSVIAFWSGKKGGGTYNCIEYALRVGKHVMNLLPGPRQGQLEAL